MSYNTSMTARSAKYAHTAYKTIMVKLHLIQPAILEIV